MKKELHPRRIVLALITNLIVLFANAQICVPPLISTQPTGGNVCIGGTATIVVIAVGLNLNYQWQVNSGSGYANCSNGGAFSGALTSTLGVTVSAGMSGYHYRCVISNACGLITTNACLLTILSPNVTISASPSDVICVGASTTLTASGASSYRWNTGASSASITVSPETTTTYTVTGTNSIGCSKTASITVTVNPLPNVTAIASPPIICTGASSTLSANGASTYQWNTGATTPTITVSPVVTTTYTVTGTSSSGCSQTASVTVSVSSFPDVTASASPAEICSGSTSTLTADGAIQYLWSTGDTSATISVSPDATTTYTVTGTNSSGCSSTASVTVTVNPSPSSVTATASPATICSGSSSTLTASGADAYYWSTGESGESIVVNPSEQTTYAVSGFNGSGCSTIATVTVYVNQSPVVTVTASPVAICPGSTSTLTAEGADTYFWSTGESGASIVVSPTEQTTYVVSGFIGNGCSSFAQATVDVDAGLCESATSTLADGRQATDETTGNLKEPNSNEDPRTILLYPNPNKGVSFIQNAPKNAVMEVYNGLGEKVVKGTIESGYTELDLNQQMKGVYLLRISHSGRVVYQARVVKE